MSGFARRTAWERSQQWRPRCDGCGRFMPVGPLPDGSSTLFVPDSHVSSEESKTYCPGCTEEYGPPTSWQGGIDSSKCQRVVRRE